MSLDPDIKSIENWPDLDDTMRNEVLQNLYIGSTDIVIEQKTTSGTLSRMGLNETKIRNMGL